MAAVTARVTEFEAEPTVELGRLRALWATIRRKPLGAASAALIAVIVLTAIFADVLAPYDPLAAQPEIRLAPPSWEHPFGTDDIGRDVFSRVIHGSRISLWVGLLAVGIGTLAGMIIGLLSGYCEGRTDLVLQRVMDGIQAIPGLVLALAIVSVLTPSTTNAMLAIAMVIIPGNSRIVRGAVLAAKQNRYVEAAQAISQEGLTQNHDFVRAAVRAASTDDLMLSLGISLKHTEAALEEDRRSRSEDKAAFLMAVAKNLAAGERGTAFFEKVRKAREERVRAA